MKILQDFILSTMDVAMFILLAQSAVDKVIKKKQLIQIFCFLVVTFLVSQFVPGVFSPVINIILMFLMVRILFVNNIIQSIYTVLAVYVVIVSIQSLLAYLLQFLGLDMSYHFSFAIVLETLTFIAVALVSKFVPINKLTRFIEKNNKVYKAILFNGFTFVMMFLIYWRLNITGIVEHLIMFTLSSAIMIILNFIVIHNGLVDEYQQKELNVYKQYLPLVEELMMEIRSKQHAYNNQIQAISAVMNQYESDTNIKGYVGALQMEEAIASVLRWGNQIVAGLLYSKYREAEKKGIHLIYDFKTYDIPERISSHDIVEMIGILIDNAVEASLEGQTDVILRTKRQEKWLDIEVLNQHEFIPPHVFDQFFDRGFSTKARKGRGFGLYNLTTIVNKYKGDLSVENIMIEGANHIKMTIELSYF